MQKSQRIVTLHMPNKLSIPNIEPEIDKRAQEDRQNDHEKGKEAKYFTGFSQREYQTNIIGCSPSP